MSAATAPPFPIFKGTVILDKNKILAYLRHDDVDNPGGTRDDVMAYDPNATGADDREGAFQLYRDKDRQFIMFRGFSVDAPDGATVLHVVKPL
jgi:hypothetical protein